MTPSRKRMITALAFVLPFAAMAASPAMATTKSHKGTHHSATHKTSAHKTPHKTKTSVKNG